MSMEYRISGTKYKYLKSYNHEKHKPYDYKRDGLLNKVMSPTIVNTTNQTTKLVLDFVETVFIFLLEYVDQLKHFKNWNYRLK